MLNSWVLTSSVMYLLVHKSNGTTTSNDRILRKLENDDPKELELVSPQNSFVNIDEIVVPKKSVKLVMNPIIEDVADPSVESTNDLSINDSTPVANRVKNFLTNLLSDGIRAVMLQFFQFVFALWFLPI